MANFEASSPAHSYTHPPTRQLPPKHAQLVLLTEDQSFKHLRLI